MTLQSEFTSIKCLKDWPQATHREGPRAGFVKRRPGVRLVPRLLQLLERRRRDVNDVRLQLRHPQHLQGLHEGGKQKLGLILLEARRIFVQDQQQGIVIRRVY